MLFVVLEWCDHGLASRFCILFRFAIFTESRNLVVRVRVGVSILNLGANVSLMMECVLHSPSFPGVVVDGFGSFCFFSEAREE